MKKGIQIIFIALVLTIATTADAKIMRKRATSTSMKTQSSAREISKATDTLKNAVKDIQNAPADEKKIARQEANDAVANLLATLHERTWMGDLRGYSEEQVKAAGKKLELLYAEEKNLDNQIKAQQLKIDEMTDKGWLWNAPKENRKEEHKEASTELQNLKNKHAKVKSAIRSEEVVAGKAYALSIKRAVYVIGAAATAGAAYAIDAYYFDSRGKAYLSEQFGKAYAKLPNVPYFGAEARKARASEEAPKQEERMRPLERDEYGIPVERGEFGLPVLAGEKADALAITVDNLKKETSRWIDLESEYYSRRAAGESALKPEMQGLASTVAGAKNRIGSVGRILKDAGLISEKESNNLWKNANKEVVENLTNAGLNVTDLGMLRDAGITVKEADAATARAINQSRSATAKTRQKRSAAAEAQRRSSR
jgi:ribosomal protein S8